MPNIAIVDDRHDPRVTLRRRIGLNLPVEWAVIDTHPLESLSDYPAWIVEHEVATLVLDERLQEQMNDSEGHAYYDGHEVVVYLRQRLPTLPIFFVTSYPEVSEVEEQYGKVEGVFPRRDFFDSRADKLIERLVRSGQKYVEVYERELADLAEISRRLATSTASDEDRSRADAIRSKLNIAFTGEAISDRAAWLDEMNKRLGELEGLHAEIESFLKGKGK